MPKEPTIKTLSSKHRNRFFWGLVLVFCVALPSLIFYTTGYRLSFESENTTIFTTGGIYITTDNLDVEVYLDEKSIDRPRLFRSAYYIQNIEAGQHRVVVQQPDLHTWVKDLPVDPHIVTEVAAYNMPLIPQVRPITPYVSATGTPMLLIDQFDMYTDTATVTVPYATTTSYRQVTFTLELNQEFEYVESLFSTTSTSSRSVFERLLDGVERFRFASSTSADTSSTSESMVERGDMQIVERGNELFAVWRGETNAVPYYFCVTSNQASTTAVRYGAHVAEAVEQYRLSTTTPLIIDGNRECRPEIKLDRLRQDVYFYDFLPNTVDLVLLQLEDGLYVTEIDDRAWQNTQLLYAGTDFQTVVENGIIYIHEGSHYFELITEIEPQP